MKRFWNILRTRFVFMFIFPLPLFAVMASPNYGIQSDSINFGGGLSSSTNYTQESTFGEIATGDSESTNFKLRAGYQQMQTSYIALSTTGNVALQSLSGLTGGISTSSADLHVITDNIAGYSLAVKATSSPALKDINGAFFSDFTPAGSDPDFQFSISTSESAFGFTPEGPDIASRYLDNGSSCSVGTGDTTDRCWEGFSLSDKIIAESGSNNQPDGATTTLKFRAEIGSAKIQDAGSYEATITVTAVSL